MLARAIPQTAKRRWRARCRSLPVISRPDHVVFGTARDEAGLFALLEQLEGQLELAPAMLNLQSVRGKRMRRPHSLARTTGQLSNVIS